MAGVWKDKLEWKLSKLVIISSTIATSAHLFNSSSNTIIMLDYYLIEFYSREVYEAGTGD